VHELGNVLDTESETSIAGYDEELGESSPIQKSEHGWRLLRNRNRHVRCLAASRLATNRLLPPHCLYFNNLHHLPSTKRGHWMNDVIEKGD